MAEQTEALAAFFSYTFVVVVVLVFYLFHFNRLYTLFLIRLIQWFTRFKYKIFFDVGKTITCDVTRLNRINEHLQLESVKFALLGGRILFKNLRYVSADGMITVVEGHILIRYWKLNLRGGLEENVIQDQQGKLCRFEFHCSGLELFLYNRSSVYDWIREEYGIEKKSKEKLDIDPPDIVKSDYQKSTSSWLSYVPVAIFIRKGAILIGNDDTSRILIAQFLKAEGIYGITNSRSIYDIYKTVVNLTLHNCNIQLRSNIDSEKNETIKMSLENIRNKKRGFFRFMADFIFRRKKIQRLQRKRRERIVNPSKYANEEEIKLNPIRNEYAKVVEIYDCEKLNLIYLIDTPGWYSEDLDDRDLPPEWAVEIVSYNSNIRYGPWSDRQRAMLQSFFYPFHYRNGVPQQPAPVNALRIHEMFRFYMQFQGDTTWRIPHREQSKDFKYMGEDKELGSRPYAWHDIKFAESSSITVLSPLYYNLDGSETAIEFRLQNPSITSSMNYAHFLTANQIRIDWKMQYPLEWNDVNIFDIQIYLHQAKIYLLRDHLTLISDLITDWSSGPVLALPFFIPYLYKFKWFLTEIEINLCCNEMNVINQPNDFNENVYMIVKSPRIDIDFDISSLEYCPEKVKMSYNFEFKDVEISFHFPPSHTLGSYLSENAKSFASSPLIIINFDYEYHDKIEKSNVDLYTLRISVAKPKIFAYGYAFHYLYLLKCNYSGNMSNFITLDEYRNRMQNPENEILSDYEKWIVNSSWNEAETFLSLSMDEALIVIPSTLYSVGECIVLKAHELHFESRSFKDLSETHVFSSQYIVRFGDPSKLDISDIMLEGTDFVHSQGLQFHMTSFCGPSPKYATYWTDYNLDFGELDGSLGLKSLKQMFAAYSTSLFNFRDDNNCISLIREYDLPVLKMTINSPKLNLKIFHMGCLYDVNLSKGVSMIYSTLFDNTSHIEYSINCPSISVKVLVPDELNREKRVEIVTSIQEKSKPWNEIVWVEIASTEFEFEIKNEFQYDQESLEKQAEFLSELDKTWGNLEFLLKKGFDAEPQTDDARDEAISLTKSLGCSLENSISESFEFPSLEDLQRNNTNVEYLRSSRSCTKFNFKNDDEDSVSFTSASSQDMGQIKPKDQVSENPNLESKLVSLYANLLSKYRIIETGISAEADKAFGKPRGLSLEKISVLDRPAIYKVRSDHKSIERNAERQGYAHEVDYSERVKIKLGETSAVFLTCQYFTELSLDLNDMDANDCTSSMYILEQIMDNLEIDTMFSLLKKKYGSECRSFSFEAGDVKVHYMQQSKRLSKVFLLDFVLGTPSFSITSRNQSSEDGVNAFVSVDNLKSGSGQLPESKGSAETNVLESDFNLKSFLMNLRLKNEDETNDLFFVPPTISHIIVSPAISNEQFGFQNVLLEILLKEVKYEINVSTERGDISENYLNFNLNEFEICSAFQGHLMVAQILNELFEISNQLNNGLRERFAHQKVILKNLLYQLSAQSAKLTNTLSDPAFLTHPSNIWRLGNREFQNTNDWKLLSRLRQVFSKPSESSWQQIALPAEITSPKMIPLSVIQENLSQWRSWDVGDVSTSMFLKQIFEFSNVNPTFNFSDYFQGLVSKLSVSCDRINFRIFHDSTLETNMDVLKFAFDGRFERSQISSVGIPMKKRTEDDDDKSRAPSVNSSTNPNNSPKAPNIDSKIAIPDGDITSSSSLSLVGAGNVSKIGIQTYPSIVYLMEQMKELKLFEFSSSNPQNSYFDQLNIQTSITIGIEIIEAGTSSETLDLEAFFKQSSISLLYCSKSSSLSESNNHPILLNHDSSSIKSGGKQDKDGASVKKSIRSFKSKQLRLSKDYDEALIQSFSLMMPLIKVNVLEREYSSKSKKIIRNDIFSFELINLFFHQNETWRTPKVTSSGILAHHGLDMKSLLLDKLYVCCPKSLLKLHSLYENWRRLDVFQDIKDTNHAISKVKEIQESSKTHHKFNFKVKSIVVSMEIIQSFTIELSVSNLVALNGFPFRYDGFLNVTNLNNLPLISDIVIQIGKQDLKVDANSLSGKERLRGVDSTLSLPKLIVRIGSLVLANDPLITAPQYRVMAAKFHHKLTMQLVDRLLLYAQLLSKELNEILELYIYSSKSSSSGNVSGSNAMEDNEMRQLRKIEVIFMGFRLDLQSAKSVMTIDSGSFRGEIKMNSTSNMSSTVGLPFSFHGKHVFVSVKSLKADSEASRKGLQDLSFIEGDFEWSLDNLQKHKIADSNCVNFRVIKFHSKIEVIAISRVLEFVNYVRNEMIKRKDENEKVIDQLRGNTKRILARVKPRIKKRLAISNFSMNNSSIEFNINIDFAQFDLKYNGISVENGNSAAYPHLSKSNGINIRFHGLKLKSLPGTMTKGNINEISIIASTDSNNTKEKDINKCSLLNLSLSIEKGAQECYSVAGHSESINLSIDPKAIQVLTSFYKTVEMSLVKLNEISVYQKSMMKLRNKGFIRNSTSKYDFKFDFDGGIMKLVSESSQLSKDASVSESYSNSSTRKGESSSVGANFNESNFKLPLMALTGLYEVGETETVDLLRVALKVGESSNIVSIPTLQFIEDSLKYMNRMSNFFKNSGLKGKHTVTQSSSNVDSPFKLSVSATINTTGKTIFICQTNPISKVSLNLELEKSLIYFNFSNSIDVDPNLVTSSLYFFVPCIDAKLKHAFSPEECFSAKLEEFQSNMTYLSLKGKSKESLSIVSRIRKIESSLNARYLQDFFIFEVIFLNRFLAIFNLDGVEERPKSPSKSKEPEIVKSDSTLSIYTLLRLQSCKMVLDLGQIVGKIEIYFESNRIRHFHTESNRGLISCYSKQMRVNSNGRLIMECILDNPWFLVLQKSPLDFISDQNDFGDFMLAVLSKVGKISILIEYNFDKIGLLDVNQITLIIRDYWKNASYDSFKNEAIEGIEGNVDLELQCDIAFNSIIAVTSRETIPSVRLLISKITSIFTEKRTLALTSILAEGGRGIIPIKGQDSKDTKTSNARVLPNEGLFVYKNTKCVPVGKITVRGADADFHMLNGNLFDSEFISISLESYLFNVVKFHNIDEEDLRDSYEIERELFIQSGSLIIKKGICPKVDITAKKAFDIEKWKHFLGQSSYKNIMKFPGSNVFMETFVHGQQNESQMQLNTKFQVTEQINYRFVTDFSDDLDVSLNIGLFRNFQETLQAYSRAAAAANEIEGPEPQKDNPKLRKLFKPLAPLVLEPQLKVLGDTTPRFDKVLSWIGMERDSVPALFHDLVTCNLEKISDFGFDIYGKNVDIEPPKATKSSTQ